MLKSSKHNYRRQPQPVVPPESFAQKEHLAHQRKERLSKSSLIFGDGSRDFHKSSNDIQGHYNITSDSYLSKSTKEVVSRTNWTFGDYPQNYACTSTLPDLTGHNLAPYRGKLSAHTGNFIKKSSVILGEESMRAIPESVARADSVNAMNKITANWDVIQRNRAQGQINKSHFEGSNITLGDHKVPYYLSSAMPDHTDKIDPARPLEAARIKKNLNKAKFLLGDERLVERSTVSQSSMGIEMGQHLDDGKSSHRIRNNASMPPAGKERGGGVKGGSHFTLGDYPNRFQRSSHLPDWYDAHTYTRADSELHVDYDQEER